MTALRQTIWKIASRTSAHDPIPDGPDHKPSSAGRACECKLGAAQVIPQAATTLAVPRHGLSLGPVQRLFSGTSSIAFA